MNELTYTQVGDYLLPDLIIGDEPQPAYGKYGMLRKRYLKEHRRTAYTSLLMSGKLNLHLAEIDELARDFVSRLVKEMAQKQGVDEAIRAQSNGLGWRNEHNKGAGRGNRIIEICVC